MTETYVDALYHADVAHESTRNQILSDITRRNISFPTTSDLHTPLVSTYTGNIISSTSPIVLVDAIIDMIMIHPVNWDLVCSSIAERLVAGGIGAVDLVNIGPGSGLLKGVGRALHAQNVSFKAQDLSLQTRNAESNDPIAIVGMAANMPGSPSTDRLWEVLEKGINTVSKVTDLLRLHAIEAEDCFRSRNLASTSPLMTLPMRALLLANSTPKQETLSPAQEHLTTSFSTSHLVKRETLIRNNVSSCMSLMKHWRMRVMFQMTRQATNGIHLGATSVLPPTTMWLT